MMHEIAHITARQRRALHERLLERARALSDEVQSGLRSDRLRGEPFDAGSIDEAAVAVSDVQRDAGELGEVIEALARIENGTYGMCVDCGSALPYLRLDAVPHARRCVRCESKVERAKRAPASL
jgi:DnaK suppressor protein